MRPPGTRCSSGGRRCRRSPSTRRAYARRGVTRASPAPRPPPHLSLVVQAFPSLHRAVLFVSKQPVAGLQVSSVQTLPSSQLSAGPPTQPPLLQVSLVVQAFPSLQGAVLALWTQPVLGLQVSSVRTLPSSQLGARPPTHTPPPHRSCGCSRARLRTGRGC